MTYDYRFTTMVELCPVSKFDLCLAPPALTASLGCMPPLLLLCTRVSQLLHVVEPHTGRTFEINADKAFRCAARGG